MESADTLHLLPTRSYGDGRTCRHGRKCVSTPATVLSRYNSGDACYACGIRDTRERKERMAKLTQQVGEAAQRMGQAFTESVQRMRPALESLDRMMREREGVDPARAA